MITLEAKVIINSVAFLISYPLKSNTIEINESLLVTREATSSLSEIVLGLRLTGQAGVVVLGYHELGGGGQLLHLPSGLLHGLCEVSRLSDTAYIWWSVLSWSLRARISGTSGGNDANADVTTSSSFSDQQSSTRVGAERLLHRRLTRWET
jgi:hypothetical protein